MFAFSVSALLALAALTAAEEHADLAQLDFHRGDLRGPFLGVFANFSGWPLPREDLQLWAPLDDLGCQELTGTPATGGFGEAPGFVVIVNRGNCTFAEKSRNAQRSGAVGLIIVNMTEQMAGDDNMDSLSIFVVGIDEESGGQIRNATLAADQVGDSLPTLTIKPYMPSLFNVSEGFLIMMATALVALGAIFSTADMKVHPRQSITAALAAPEEEVVEVDQIGALGFFFIGSCFLVLLFFTMHWAIYVLIFGFCCGGGSTLLQLGAILLTHFFPSLGSKMGSLPLVGPIRSAEVIAAIPAAIIVISWLVFRNTTSGWIFQDIIGAGFLLQIQRTLRMPSIKVASFMLTAMFFFDIFWVFISPLIFHESVMVRVATGGGTGQNVPMVLRIPAIGDPFASERLLGFGDIALPGLLVSFLRRYDLMGCRSAFTGYFGPALIGYAIGMVCTFAALVIMRMGQPALLYLVPGTLGTTIVLATCRGELGSLWEGIPAEGSPKESADSLDREYGSGGI